MNLLKAIFLISALSSTSHAVIFDQDDRTEYYDVKNPLYLQVAQSAAAAIPITALKKTDRGTFEIKARTFGETYDLCSSERFYSQPAAAECSGFLVADDLLITAGHCTEGIDSCKTHRWVFGYRRESADQNQYEVPSENVYGCKVLYEEFRFLDFVDFSIIKLDRKVTNFKPVRWKKQQSSHIGTKVVLAGFPRGLPLKLAEGLILDTTSDYLKTNVDAYGVNSGSLLFNAATGEAEGVLSAGPVDFDTAPNGCTVSRILPTRRDYSVHITRFQLPAALLETW